MPCDTAGQAHLTPTLHVPVPRMGGDSGHREEEARQGWGAGVKGSGSQEPVPGGEEVAGGRTACELKLQTLSI